MENSKNNQIHYSKLNVNTDEVRSGIIDKLCTLTTRLNSAQTRREVAEMIIDSADDFFQWDASNISYYDDVENKAYSLIAYDVIDGKRCECPDLYNEPTEPSPFYKKALGQGPLLYSLEDIRKEPEPEDFGDIYRPSQTLMYVPIIDTDMRTVGLMTFQSYTKNAYTKNDLSTLQLIASHCSSAMHRCSIEEALTESDERFDLISKATRDAIYDWKIQTNEIWRNDNYLDTYKLSPDDAKIVEWWENNIHPEDKKYVMENQRDALNGSSERWTCQYRLQSGGQEYLFVEDRALIVRDKTGLAVRLIGSVENITNRKMAEDEIRRLASFPNENPHPVLESTKNGEILYYNPAAWRLQEDLGCKLIEILPVNHVDLLNRCLEDNIPTTNIDSEYGGNLFRWNYYPVSTSNVVHIYGIDVTEIKLQKVALTESESRFETLADSTPALIWMTDEKGKLIYANREWLKYGEQSAQEFSNENWNALIHTDDRELYNSIVNKAIIEEESFKVEFRIKRKDSKIRRLLGQGKPRYSPNGKFIGLICCCVDITESKEIDEILRNIVQKTSADSGINFLESLAKNLSQALNIKYAFIAEAVDKGNTRVRTLAMWDGENFIKNFEYDLSETPCEEVALRSSCAYPANVQKLFPNDNLLAKLNVHGYVGCALKSTKGEFIGLIAIMDQGDITHYKLADAILSLFSGRASSELERIQSQRQELHMETQMRHIQKLEGLGVLASGIAHDYNNILSSILGNTGLALMDMPKDSPTSHLIREIEIAAIRASVLTRQLLSYSNPDTQNISKISLNQSINDTFELLKVSTGRNTQLVRHLSPDPIKIDAEPNQFQQVLMNLVLNAAESIGESVGTITISTGIVNVDDDFISMNKIFGGQLTHGSYAYLKVVDTGSGMDNETLVKMFDPFFTTKHTGRGLGLSAALGIIQSHNASLAVQSSPEKGTSVQVLFPFIDSHIFKVSMQPSEPQEISGAIVLVADDEESVLKVATRTMKKFGYTVIEASNGAEAVECFRRHSDEITLVLLDMTMPVMNGEQAMKEIKHLNFRTPVILMSGYSEQDLSTNFAESGFDGFIQKPFRPQDILECLEDILTKKKSKPQK